MAGKMTEEFTFQIRASTLSGYTDCPRRGAVKLFWKLIRGAGYEFPETPHGVGAAVGTGVHAGAAHMLYAKRDHLPPVPVKELHEIGIEAYRGEVRDGVMFDETTGNHNRAEKQVKILVEVYQSEILPIVIPGDIEASLSSRVSTSVEVTGHPDNMCGTEINDLKTGRSPDGHYAQLGGYSLLAQGNGRPRPDRLVIHWLPRKYKDMPVPKIRVYDVALCEQLAKSTVKYIAGQLEAFLKSGNPESFPVNPMSTLCSDKYCPACGSKWCKIKIKGE